MVGSINQDAVLRVERRPRPGETVTGARLAMHPGGKGANQAVAAARLGAEVIMVGRVGNDRMGEEMRAGLGRAGVDTTHVHISESAPTGMAFITVTPDGENSIVVAPGANVELGVDDVAAAAPRLSVASVVVLQLEIPLEAVEAAAAGAGEATWVLLNAAPFVSLPDALLAMVRVLVVNEHEASALLGDSIESSEDAMRAGPSLLNVGVETAIVTLGDAGALVIESGGVTKLAASPVEVVDTTGAGDAFVGAVAAGLGRGLPLVEAARYGVAAGSRAVQGEGAQGSFPTAHELEAQR